MERNKGTVWIPEAPKYPGLYANHDDHSGDGKILFPDPVQPSTNSAHHAKQFATQAECTDWCRAHPVPVFEPRDHGFSDS